MEAAKTAGAARGWLRRLLGYCWRYRASVLLAFGGALGGMAISALTPLIERLVMDDVILSHRRPLAPWAILLVGAGLAQFGASFVRRYIGGKLSFDVQHDLRTDVLASLSRLDGAQQDEIQTGQVVSRAISDITMVQGLLSMLPVMSGSLLLFVLSLGVMLWLSPLLTLVGLAVGPGLFAVAVVSRRRLFPATWDAQQRAALVAGVVEENVTGVRVVKGFGQEEQELGRLEDVGGGLFASRLRAVRLTSLYNPTLQVVPAFGQIGVLALGGWLAARGEITIGTFLAFSTYLAEMISPVRMLSALLTMGQQARASVIRVFEVIDSQPHITERPDAVVLETGDLEARDLGAGDLGAGDLGAGAAEVELDQVRFGYVASQPVLSDLTLRVTPGETLALVGTSGSGKSTVSLLLPRFYDVHAGAVRIDGHDVRDLTLASLRAAIGLVLEDSFLFSDTVRANIAYGRPEATEEQVVAAARAAEADEFVRALPQGYDTVVGEQGLTLSGGQRQRIALARALITDPRILVLDDATSAVDPRLEAEIHATLGRVMRGRTTLLIAHRRSTLQLADRIAVLDEGRLVDLGTHEELTARCPLYRLLLSGPGDDAEGVDAGELPATTSVGVLAPAVAPVPVTARVAVSAADGVTPQLWNRGDADAAEASAASRRDSPALAAGHGGGGHGGGGFMASAPPTPELLAAVDALPPARDVPNVAPDLARAPDPDFSLARILAPFRRPLALGLGLVALDALAGLVLPILIRDGIDNGIQRIAYGTIALVSVIGLAVALADWGIEVAQTRVTGRTGERLLYTLRVKMFAHLQRLGLDFYERELSGRIMTRMTTDVDALSTFLQTGLTTAVVSVLSFVGILIVLVVLNPVMGLAILAVLPVLLVATVVFRIKSIRAYNEAREKVGAVNADFQENVAGLRVAQAFGREERNNERFARLSDDYRKMRWRTQRYVATYFPFLEFLSEATAALVLVVGAAEVHSGALTAGALIAYLLYIDLFFSPIQQLSQVFDGYQQAAVGLRRIRDLLRTPTSTPRAAHPVPVGPLAGELVFDRVRFAYQGAAADAVTGIDLRIPPGQTVALVGETGAGKSTLVKLAARFYDVTAGAVRVDGTDIRDFDLAAYRHRLGVVPQEAHLFVGTVRDAIAYGRPDASDAEVEAAAREVAALDMIGRLAGGFLHPVGERGRNLSAGQRQLIALARAQLVHPDILLLDEATAALDLATEAAVTRATERLTGHRTTIVVAHRLTTAARADRIVVLDHGRIVEDGTHEELAAAGGHYARLWEAYVGEESESLAG